MFTIILFIICGIANVGGIIVIVLAVRSLRKTIREHKEFLAQPRVYSVMPGREEKNVEVKFRPATPHGQNHFRELKLCCPKCTHVGTPVVKMTNAGITQHRTATCGECGAYIKHLSKDEVKIWERSQQPQSS